MRKIKPLAIYLTIVFILVIIWLVNQIFKFFSDDVFSFICMVVFCIGLTTVGITSLRKAMWFKNHAKPMEARVLSVTKEETLTGYRVRGQQAMEETYHIFVEFFDGDAVQQKNIEYQGTGKRHFEQGKTVEVYYDKNFKLQLVTPSVFRVEQGRRDIIFGGFCLLFGLGFLILTILSFIPY